MIDGRHISQQSGQLNNNKSIVGNKETVVKNKTIKNNLSYVDYKTLWILYDTYTKNFFFLCLFIRQEKRNLKKKI